MKNLNFEDKNIINIYNKNGEEIPMELLALFKLKGYKGNYIIYSELDRSKNYVAKFASEKTSNLETNLSEKELELCNEIFERIEK